MTEATPAVEGLDQLLSLEEKIQQTIHLLQSLRAEKEELLRENARLRLELDEHSKKDQAQEERLGRLEKERAAVRTRVQRLLEQVDALTHPPSESA